VCEATKEFGGESSRELLALNAKLYPARERRFAKTQRKPDKVLRLGPKERVPLTSAKSVLSL